MSHSLPQVAVLGLGIIGSRAVARLRDHGYPARCWSRTPHQEIGEVSTAQEAVHGAEFISLYLKDALATRETVLQIMDSVSSHAILLNHSTIDLATTKWLAEVCHTRNIAFLDAPFTGSKIAAQNGQLFYYVSGKEELIERSRDFLNATSKGQLFCGEIGSATVLKLATNLISATTVQALSEAMAIATRHGIAADAFVEAVANNACGSGLSGMKLPSMALGDYQAHFTMDNMRKDSVYALELARHADLDTPAIAAVSKRMTEMCEKGFADLDYSALAKPYLDTEV